MPKQNKQTLAAKNNAAAAIEFRWNLVNEWNM